MNKIQILTRYLKKAIEWAFIASICAEQDEKCTDDPSIKKAISSLKIAKNNLLGRLVSYPQYENWKNSKKQTLTKYAVQWIQGKMEDNKLSDPDSISLNVMQSFHDRFITKESEEIIAIKNSIFKKNCKVERQKVLNIYYVSEFKVTE